MLLSPQDNPEWEWTPLVMAASDGYLDVSKLLIERGADVNYCDKV